MAMPLLQESKKNKKLRLVSMASLILKQVAESPDAPVNWPPPIRVALSELTPKQRRFSICIASGMSNHGAYRMAYDIAENTPDSSLYSDASILLSHPKVSVTVELLLSWLDRDWLLESKEVVEYGYQRLYEESEHALKSSDRIRAATNLLKAHGAFVSRSEVRHIHTLDKDTTNSLVDSIASLLSAPEPKTPAQITTASVASVEFVDPE